MTVTPQALEAGARALYDEWTVTEQIHPITQLGTHQGWKTDDLPFSRHEDFGSPIPEAATQIARAVLAAAAPLIAAQARAEALEEAANEVDALRCERARARANVRCRSRACPIPDTCNGYWYAANLIRAIAAKEQS